MCEWPVVVQGKWGGRGGAYEHDVLDIVQGHSSCWIRLVCGMNMIVFGYEARHIILGLSSIKVSAG